MFWFLCSLDENLVRNGRLESRYPRWYNHVTVTLSNYLIIYLMRLLFYIKAYNHWTTEFIRAHPHLSRRTQKTSRSSHNSFIVFDLLFLGSISWSLCRVLGLSFSGKVELVSKDNIRDNMWGRAIVLSSRMCLS